MLQLSRQADYAVVLLTLLAGETEPASARVLAERSGLPAAMVAKVLKGLAAADLLDSRRGAHGGYTLAHDPAAITIADVIESLEGPISLTLCSDLAQDCGLDCTCPTRPHWLRINDALRTALADVTLADMAAPACAGAEALASLAPTAEGAPVPTESDVQTATASDDARETWR